MPAGKAFLLRKMIGVQACLWHNGRKAERIWKDVLYAVGYLTVSYIVVAGLIMFQVEPESFDSLFDAIYWSTTALTTVGYGDIYPITVFGKLVSMISSVVGIAVVALPAGVITGGYIDEVKRRG